MKKNYCSPIMQVVCYTALDVITTSQGAHEKDPFEMEGMSWNG